MLPVIESRIGQRLTIHNRRAYDSFHIHKFAYAEQEKAVTGLLQQ